MFPSPMELSSGLFHTSASAGEGGGSFVGWAIFIILCISLSEPLKLILRRNIGARAISIYWIFLSSAVFLFYGISMFLLAYFVLGDRDLNAAYWTGLIYRKYIFFSASAIYAFLSFYVLVRGMNEYYRSRAISSKALNELDYRGDSVFMNDKQKAGWQQNKIWRTAEPKTCFWMSVTLSIINVVLGFPLLIASISFWLNEWYQVHYKEIRAKESYQNMKIEAEKANNYYNEVATNEPISKVFIED